MDETPRSSRRSLLGLAVVSVGSLPSIAQTLDTGAVAASVVIPPLETAPETVVGPTPQTVFAFDFPFFAAADLRIYVDGVMLEPGDYTVVGASIQNGGLVEGGYGGGRVTLNEAVSDCTVTIDRFVVGERQTQFRNDCALSPPALNADINKIVARQQDLKRQKVERPHNRAGKFLAFDADGNEVATSGMGADVQLREDLVTSAGASLVGYRRTAGANLRTQTLLEFIEGGPIMPSQFAGTEGEQFLRAIAEAGASRDGGLGQTVQLPRGELTIDAPFNCTDRVSIIGVNKRGTVITPSRGFAGAYMATVVNGASSMFDNALERLTLNCNHVRGLGGIVADAWQEGGGLCKVLIEKFTTEGVRIRRGSGGAAHCQINDVEIMGSNRIKATTGIYLEEVSSIGAFVLTATNCTVTGSPRLVGAAGDFRLDKGIHVENDSLICNAVHFEEAITGIYLDGDGHHILHGVTGANTVTNVIEIASTFVGTFEIRGCRRWGAANLLKDNRVGGLGIIAYDTDISSAAPLGIGSNAAGGNFNGALATPNIDKSFGVTAIVKNSTGDYTILLSRGGIDANSFLVIGSTNTAGGTVDARLSSSGSVNLVSRTADGAPSDANEIKFLVVRCA